jgi:hypothetical protein
MTDEGVKRAMFLREEYLRLSGQVDQLKEKLLDTIRVEAERTMGVG